MRPFLVTLVHYHIGPPPRPHLVSATFLTLKRAKRFARKLAEDNHAVVVVEDTRGGSSRGWTRERQERHGGSWRSLRVGTTPLGEV